jgi:hypothetical protein
MLLSDIAIDDIAFSPSVCSISPDMATPAPLTAPPRTTTKYQTPSINSSKFFR